jgi:hypothetical protein
MKIRSYVISVPLTIISCLILISAIRPDHSIITSGTALRGEGNYIYTEGGRSLYRLDRKTGDFVTIYTGRNPIYRYDISPDKTKAVCYFEGEPFLHLLTLSTVPARASRIALKIPEGFSDSLDTVYFDESGSYIMAASSAYSDRCVAFYVDLKKPGTSVNTLSGGGSVIIAAGADLIYITHSKSEYGRYGKTQRETVRWKNIITGVEKNIYSFEGLLRITEKDNDILQAGAEAVDSESPSIAAVRIKEPHKLMDKIIIYKGGTGVPLAEIESPREFNGKPVRIERVHLTAEAKHIIYGVKFSYGDQYETFLAYDVKSGKLEKASDALLSRVIFKTKYRDFRNTGKGLLFRYIEGSDDLVLVDINAKTYSENSMLPFAKIPKAEWAGLVYFFPDPDEFYAGIEKGGGRYYIRFPLKALKAPGTSLPEGVSPFEFIQSYRKY